MSFYFILLLGAPDQISTNEKQTNAFASMHIPNAYAYPPTYNYNSGINYQYNWDQNTKEQMEAYSKLVLANYQNGQQFCQANMQQYPQNQALNASLNLGGSNQNISHETPNAHDVMVNDSTKAEDCSTNSCNSSTTAKSSDSHTPAPNSTSLPSPTINTSNAPTPNSSILSPSSNPSTTPRENHHQPPSNNSQLYSPSNSFGNWPTNNFPYTADNPYAAFYNNPSVAAAAMYNQSMTMGGSQHQQYFTGGAIQQQPDSTTSGNMNRGWAQHPANPAAAAYPFHPAAFAAPFSDSAAALYNNYAQLWNPHHNTGQFMYGNTLHNQQANTNGFVNNLNSMNEKLKDYCDSQQQQHHATTINNANIKSVYNNHNTQAQHQDKPQQQATTSMEDQHMVNDPSSLFSNMATSNTQPLDLELTYRNNPELAEKLRQVSLKKPRVTFSIKQVVELEKEFHSSRLVVITLIDDFIPLK